MKRNMFPILLILIISMYLFGDDSLSVSKVNLDAFAEDYSKIKIDESQVYKVKDLVYKNGAVTITFCKGYMFLLTPVCGKEIGFAFDGKIRVHVESDNKDFLRQVKAVNGSTEIERTYKNALFCSSGKFIEKIKTEGKKKDKFPDIIKDLKADVKSWFDFEDVHSFTGWNYHEDILNGSDFGATFALFWAENDYNIRLNYSADEGLKKHYLSFVNRYQKYARKRHFVFDFTEEDEQESDLSWRVNRFDVLDYDLDVDLFSPYDELHKHSLESSEFKWDGHRYRRYKFTKTYRRASLSCDGTIRFICNADSTDFVVFTFTKPDFKFELLVNYIKNENMEDLSYYYKGSVLFVKLKEQAAKGDTVTVKFRYEAPFLDADTETIYTMYAWYPVLKTTKPWDAEIDISYPVRYKCLASGKLTNGKRTDKRKTLYASSENIYNMTIGLSYNNILKKRITDSLIVKSMFRSNRMDILRKFYQCAEYMEANIGKCPFGEISVLEDGLGYSTSNGLVRIDFDYGDNNHFRYSNSIRRFSEQWLADYLNKDRANEDWVKNCITNYISKLFIIENGEFNGVTYDSIIEECRKILNDKIKDAESCRMEVESFIDDQTGVRQSLLMHNLRVMLTDHQTNNFDVFKQIIREFLAQSKTQTLNGDVFIETVNRVTGEDYNWFFNQNIMMNNFPKYSCKYKQKETGTGNYSTVISISQKDVPESYKCKLPIEIKFENGEKEIIVLDIEGNSFEKVISRQNRIEDIDFDPYNVIVRDI